MQKSILIISEFSHLPGANANDRFMQIGNQLIDRGWKVKFFISSFDHIYKEQRATSNNPNYEMIHEPGYSRNVSIARMLSHILFAINTYRNLKKKNQKEYSVIYVAIPTSMVALSAQIIARQWGSHLVLDIQDIWPDSFKVFSRNSETRALDYFISLLNKFWKPLDRYILQRSSLIIAVSKTYLRWAQDLGVKDGLVSYLGSNMNAPMEFQKTGNEYKNSIVIIYQGTLSYSYDIRTLIDAIGILNEWGYSNVVCEIIGNGPERQELINYRDFQSVKNVEFLERMPFRDLILHLCKADIAVNAITKSSRTSIPNKVFDYFACSLPVVNSVTGELQEELDKMKAGIFYQAGNTESLAKALEKLILSPDLRLEMGMNANKLGKLIGDREVEHSKIINSLEKLI